MNLAFGRSNGHEEVVWTTATEFAEVVYETDEVLVVSVAADLAGDELLTGALMDVIATSDRCDTAESAITTLATELKLEVRTGESRGEHHLTIASRMPAVRADPMAPSRVP